MDCLLSSMTGFGRSSGVASGRGWSWEVRSVNARNLDIRLKLPPGWEGQEAALRQAAGAALRRGAVQAVLALAADPGGGITVHTERLDQLVALAIRVAARIPGAPPPRAEALLGLPGVLRVPGEGDAAIDAAAIATIRDGFAAALACLESSRQAEGALIGVVLERQIGEIAALTKAAHAAADKQQTAQRQRLQESLRILLGEVGTISDSGPHHQRIALSEERLAQELASLASRSDVREELDRLGSHMAQARALVAHGQAVGRRLDFLVQEFNREANTLCSKSATGALTSIGLELKAVIEQLREQVQNIE